MAANSNKESGQSLLEFLLVLPVFFSLVIVLIRSSTAIQMSINDQKYARYRTLFVSYNSPVYPRRSAGTDVNYRDRAVVKKGMNMMLVGISENSIADSGEEEFGAVDSFVPYASTYNITPRGAGSTDDGSVGEEPARRSFVRIRNTVTLCTPVFSLKPGVALTSATLDENTFSGKAAVPFCASPSVEP